MIQVAVNDLILLVAFTPIVAFLLGVSNVFVPYDTLFLSVILFVVIPLLSGYLSRRYIIKHKGLGYFENVFIKKFDNTTILGLLLTLIIIFTFQGDIILNNPLHVLYSLLFLLPSKPFLFFTFPMAGHVRGGFLITLRHLLE